MGGKRKRWEEIISSKKAPPCYDECTVKNEAILAQLETEPQSIKDKALGCLKEYHIRESVATFRVM